MSKAVAFERKLDKLLERRTLPILAAIGRKSFGPQKDMTKQIRDRRTNDLIELATQILLDRARKEFRKMVSFHHRHHIRGKVWQKRSSRLLEWARRNFSGPIVYAFWRREKCLYIGKGNDWGRLKNYEKSIYLDDADSVMVYQVKSRSMLPKAECIAVHRFHPRDNKVRPAKVRWGKTCPICQAHDTIRGRLWDLLT